MLIIGRKPNAGNHSTIVVRHRGEELVLQIISIVGGQVRLGFEGPMNFEIRRAELLAPAEDPAAQVNLGPHTD